MPPPVQLFLTTIASNVKLRSRQDYILRILQVKKIPYQSFDLASDEKAKRLWRRKAPPGNQDLPGMLVGYKWPGTFEQFEEAVEFDELDIFLRRNDPWDPDLDDDYNLEERPTGVPGAYTPNQMTGHTPSHAPAGSVPQKAVREGEMDMGDHLEGFGLQGVKVTADDLADLVKSLGLDDENTKDLIGGLDFSTPSSSGPSKSSDGEPKPAKQASSSTTISGTLPSITIPGNDPEEEGEEVAEPEGSDPESDNSDVAELPAAPRLRPGLASRKRTDERPLTSPLSPGPSSARSFGNESPKTPPPPSPSSKAAPEVQPLRSKSRTSQTSSPAPKWK